MCIALIELVSVNASLFIMLLKGAIINGKYLLTMVAYNYHEISEED